MTPAEAVETSADQVALCWALEAVCRHIDVTLNMAWEAVDHDDFFDLAFARSPEGWRRLAATVALYWGGDVAEFGPTIQ